MSLQVLVLDGEQRSALAAVRSLGRAGLAVGVASSHPRPLAAASKHCVASFWYTDPAVSPDGFIASLGRHVAMLGDPVVMPMTDLTSSVIVDAANAFGQARIAVPSASSFKALSTKSELAKIAKQLSIPTPVTVEVTGSDDIATALRKVRPPYVVKPALSKFWHAGRLVSEPVRYLETEPELRSLVDCSSWTSSVPLLVQEQIQGSGRGIFAIYEHGRPLGWFAHQRLRERPPTGGVSVLSESVEPDTLLRQYAQRLLDSVGWHGVAMVEFKVTPEGRPYLIEVNGRFWGSLQLAIDAGVDFPLMLYRLALREEVQAVDKYQTGRRCRWLLGDLDRLYLILRASRDKYSAEEKARAVAEFLDFRDKRTRCEVNRKDDFRPFLRELKQYVWR